MATIKNVILVGAGGNLGPSLLQALTSTGNLNVSVLSRENSSYTPPTGVSLHKTDYSHASLVKAFKGQDAVVSAVASAATVEQIKLIDAAIEADVKRFLPAEFGSDTAHPQVLKSVPVFRGKKNIVAHLMSNEDKISWTGMVSGPFTDWGIKVGFLGFDLQKSTATIYGPDYHKNHFSTSTLPTIGLAVSRVLTTAYTKTANQYVFFRSVTTTQDEILAALEKVTGKTWEKNEVNLDEAVQAANEKLAKGDMSGIATLIIGQILDPEAGDWDKRGVVANDLLDLPKENIGDIVRNILGE